MMSARHFALLLAAFAALGTPALGATGEWTTFQAVPGNNAVIDDREQDPTVRWRADAQGKIVGSLAIANDVVYFDSFDAHVYAVNARTGVRVWSAKAGNVLMSTPLVSDGRVIVGSGTNAAIDAAKPLWGRPEGDEVDAFAVEDGHRIWSFETIGEDMPTGAIENGTLFFSNGDWHAYALNVADGTKRWQADLPGLTTMAGTDVVGSSVIVVTCRLSPAGCNTVSLDVTNGKIDWVAPYGGNDCSPAVDGGRIFVAMNGADAPGPYQFGGTTDVVALDLRTGALAWRWHGPAGPYTSVGSSEQQISPTVQGGVVYDAIPTLPGVVALDAKTGAVRWQYRTWAPVKMTPVVTQNHVVFGDTSGVLYSLDAANGTLSRTKTFPSPFTASSPIAYGATFYIANGASVYASPLREIL